MSSGPPPFLPRIAATSSSNTHTRSPAKFARKLAFSIKREEIPPTQELEQNDGERAVVSDADAQLLLGLHLGSATSASPVTSPASRVSIASLVNAVDIPVPMRIQNFTTPPHSAPPGVLSFSDPPVHQLRARSASPRTPALPPLVLTPPGAYAPEIVSAVESRATRSMSISVEPEPALVEVIARPISPTPSKATPSPGKTSTKTPSHSSLVKSSSSSPAKSSPSKSSPSKTISPFKLSKPRGRVSKGPKKREGKGWIIESCTTSGAPSDNETDPQPDRSSSPSPSKPSPKPSAIAAKLEDLSRDIFGGDSDMSDLSSDSDEAEEYDPGLTGLPALPVSSESEYDPGLRGEMAGEKRSRRRGVNYQDFQSSARPSVRLMTRSAGSPSKSEADVVGSDAGKDETEETSRSAGSGVRGRKARRGSTRGASKAREAEVESGSEGGGETSRTTRGAASGSRARTRSKVREAESEPENEEPRSGSVVKRGAATGSRARGRGTRRGSGRSVAATSTSVSATPASTRGTRRGKSRNVVPAPVSAVSSVSLGAWADDATSANSVLGPRLSRAAARARQSTNGSSKSRIVGESSTLTELSSPSLGGTQLLDSPLLVGTRQQESPSLGGTRSDAGMTHVSESVEGTHVSETTGAGGVDEAGAVEVRVEKSPRKKIAARDVGHGRMDATLESPKRTSMTIGSPERAGGVAQSPRVKAIVEVVLPPRSKSKHHSSPTRAIATPAHLVQATIGGGSSRSPQQVYVLMPSSSTRHAFGRRGREPSSTSEEPGVEEVVVKGRRKSHGAGDRGSPSKRSRVDRGALSSRDKGKGKAVADDPEMDYEMTDVPGRRPRRQPKPTTRALESAQQELSWDGGDLEGESIWVTIQGNQSTGSSAPSEGTGSRSMSLSRSASVGVSAGRSARGNGKRRREDYEGGSSGSKRQKASSTAESAVGMAPMVHLQSGDFILRVQGKKCFHYAWDQSIVPRCLACRKKKAGDTCRFAGIRYFKLTPVSFDVIGVSFDSRQTKEQPDYHLPLKWNITPDIAHVDRIRSVISRALYPVLQEELKHALKENAIWRPVEIEVRATCDVCATSMFASCHMCTQCGRELCGECYRQVEFMCPAGTPTYYRSAERKDQQLHKYRACAGGNIFHVPSNFRPITRFTRQELEETLKDMKTIIDNNAAAQTPSRPGSSHITKWASRIPAWNPTSPQASTEPPALSETGSSHDVSSPRGTPDPQLASMPIIASPSMSPTHEDPFAPEVSVEAGKRPVASQHGYVDLAGVPAHPIHYFPRDITEDIFKPIWARGEAVVVQGLLDDFKIKWTPEYFIQEYGEQDCFVVNCDTDKETWSTVEGFFNQFGQPDRGDAILKLKDWPARADFRDDFPDLFVDFMNALPIPNYTRRDGILNVASHFATNAIAPDLGPKMYNAFASKEGPGGQGSTRLHMDMADAVNIMMFANDSKDGLPGVAAWDIFRASDSDKIRAYLRRHFENKSEQYRDPIHSQLFYLDSDHRRRLYEEEKVYSWRIYQRPGEAVFIPAGCAHQVCNLADCIKVAIDFVSLENIDRCEKLTAEFRNENDTFTWKEDVLQLRTMMMYAWRSAAQLRKAWEEQYPSAKG